MIYADLHLHSKYSRAVSKNCDLKHLHEGALLKGTNLLGTGDFTHPLWFKELKENLTPATEGLYYYKDNKDVLFMLTCEVANFYRFEEKARKIHNIIHCPSLEVVEQLNEALSKKSNLRADGRPMLAKTSNAELVEIVESIDEKNYVVPAHAWTPWFGVFGSKSGFDSLKDAFEDKYKSIFAIETGLSSDIEMNRRLSQLDNIALVSYSDAHSPHPWRLGRECTLFDLQNPSFDSVRKAIRDKKTSTIEVEPAYGKYHLDGHRACGFSSEPEETKKLKGLCPKCGKPLTIGVLDRIEELADRKEAKNTEAFKKILPLHELLAAVMQKGLSTKTVQSEASKLMSLGSELFVLLEATEEELNSKTSERVVKAILMNRENKIQVTPGFDGEYGKLIFSSTK